MMKYFAYGSNMLFSRIKERVASATKVDIGYLCEHELRFHKVGQDGSAKADIHHTGERHHRVYGVIYHIDIKEKIILDRYEHAGIGYDEKEVQIITDAGSFNATSYYAIDIAKEALVPFDWYHALVLHGALEHDLPADYIEALKKIAHKADEDSKRAAKHFKLLNSSLR